MEDIVWHSIFHIDDELFRNMQWRFKVFLCVLFSMENSPGSNEKSITCIKFVFSHIYESKHATEVAITIKERTLHETIRTVNLWSAPSKLRSSDWCNGQSASFRHVLRNVLSFCLSSAYSATFMLSEVNWTWIRVFACILLFRDKHHVFYIVCTKTKEKRWSWSPFFFQ